ncbi:MULTISPECIES: hypothiocyanous acid reductase MerA [Staphylococcus]|uniref:hypothiocyanous acid reductase MerA n=1 Tax=Staphylococcus TaxID=1279 RepID=UPI000CD03120|nr:MULTISPECIES: hypothiocyanous acid reductase MerA [Staphylococcus]POA03885.1 dihydrolipoamide dehydrogenase [Staphylococcus caprae]SUL96386.1 mercuric reductase-like protein [Staphylococcus caprae]HCG75058.1 FAD-containing oxidoreductase [Staphylococcus sp.]
MTTYDLIIIGFGKAGKTLAAYAASQGQHVALIEQSAKMYGGTCINIGCIPSKTLVHDGIEGASFGEAFSRKNEVVSALNNKNYNNLASIENIDILDYKAKFISNNAIALLDEAGNVKNRLTGDKIVINTGAQANIPNIKGIETTKNIYDSTSLLNIDFQPQELVIVGGGYIALEFASMFSNLGSNVTVLEYGNVMMPREDREVAELAIQDLRNKGISVYTNVETTAFSNEGDATIVHTNQGDFKSDAVLLATGRKPNTDGLGLENTDINIGQHGEIVVNDKLQTTVEHIYAAGDVKGGLQFTYISLDDFRILQSQFFGYGTRTTENRGIIPYTVFIDPPLSRVGLTATEAKAQGFNFLENKIYVNTIPRHKINNDPRGVFKVVINQDNNEILGASLYGKESEELINIIKLAIDQHIPYTVLRDNIYTHPTMAESFNDLFKL